MESIKETLNPAKETADFLIAEIEKLKKKLDSTKIGERAFATASIFSLFEYLDKEDGITKDVANRIDDFLCILTKLYIKDNTNGYN